MNVLVVDDDPLACKLLDFLLTSEGYAVQTARTAQEAVTSPEQTSPDLLILDVVLPGTDGFQLYRQLRGSGCQAATIFLTACAEMSDKVAGLELGADDYMVKPFEPAELTARVKAVLRRYQLARMSAQGVKVRAGGVVLDVGALRVQLPGRKVVALTRSEAKVLQCLMANGNRVVTRSTLAEVLWGIDVPRGGDQISVYVRRLRKKVETDPSRPRYIESVRKLGYRFRLPL